MMQVPGGEQLDFKTCTQRWFSGQQFVERQDQLLGDPMNAGRWRH
jgi:hypothetical protein